MAGHYTQTLRGGQPLAAQVALVPSGCLWMAPQRIQYAVAPGHFLGYSFYHGDIIHLRDTVLERLLWARVRSKPLRTF